jgi:hypothetical protein
MQRLIAQSIEPMNAVNDAATGGETILCETIMRKRG